MEKMEQTAVPKPGMSDAAVKLKTGKTWVQWFAALDKAGGAEQSHRAIADMLFHKFGVGPWWSQMVTVEYERARGLREKYQSGGSYRVSASKTIACDLQTLYSAAADARSRKKWFPEGAFKPASQTKNKYLRGSWNGDANIEMNFSARSAGKSQVAVQVNKLAGRKEVESVRAIWKDSLARLEILVGGK